MINRVSAKEKFNVGAHGYDNEEPQMRAIFMASGPAFKKNYTAQPFNNVDLYSLICRIESLNEPHRRPDGTIKGVEQLLSNKSGGTAAATSTAPVIGILSAMLLHVITAHSLWTINPNTILAKLVRPKILWLHFDVPIFEWVRDIFRIL